MERNPYYFDQIADVFEDWTNPFDLETRLHWFAYELDRLPIEGETVLDVGSGLGYFSRLVAARGGHPISLDIAGELLRQRKDSTMCVQGSALNLPFPDGTFPVVVSSECIEHTPDPLLAIREMVRVLRPGGSLVLSTPNWVWRWSATVAGTLGIRKFSGIENWLRRRQVRRSLREMRAEIVADHGLYLVPFQIKPLWPLLEWINEKGQALRPLMINQCWVARKIQ
ncbi:MAG: class I SAM-dependent methyltransferase [Vicinamibacteria bacterium]